MKQIILATVLAASVGGSAFAQAVVVGPEDETIVRDTVTTEHWRSVEPPAGVVVREGVELPPAVELREIPRLPRYRGVVIGGRTVLVEPGTRRVVRVIER